MNPDLGGSVDRDLNVSVAVENNEDWYSDKAEASHEEK